MPDARKLSSGSRVRAVVGLAAAIAVVGAVSAMAAPRIAGGAYDNCRTRGGVTSCPVQVSVNARARTLRFFTFPDCAFSVVDVRGVRIRSNGTFHSTRDALALSGRFLSRGRIRGTFRYTGSARSGCRVHTQSYLVHHVGSRGRG